MLRDSAGGAKHLRIICNTAQHANHEARNVLVGLLTPDASPGVQHDLVQDAALAGTPPPRE